MAEAAEKQPTESVPAASPMSPDASADAEAVWETALKIARMDGIRVAFVPE